MTRHFLDQAIQGLNTRQRQAVETLEGPVLVIAGPGSGKTQILAARIANILRSTDARPENILCLTYTDAGAVAMRNRLLEFVGPDAYKVDVLTFHSFCSRMIQENSDYFGVRGLTPVSGLEQYRFAREIIDSFPADHPLARPTGDLYFEAKRLLELYGVMKQEGWSPSWLAVQAEICADELDSNPDFYYKRAGRRQDDRPYKKGDLNEEKLKDALRKIQQFKAAAETFDQYQALLRENRRYDFADMILWCIDAFKKSPGLLTEYQDRYLYKLVDEYQDTSGAQYELLMLLADYSDAPNLFAVGDDDQSIFRFQGASVANIRQFQQRFAGSLTTVTLTDNYRSSQNILDAAGALISRNQERLTDDKQLAAVNEDVCALATPVELRCYPTLALEMAAIASEIVTLKEAGVPLRQIAVIYRNHRQSEDIIRFLTAQGIPVVTRRRADALKESLVEKFFDVLRYLAAELSSPHSGEVFLFKMLHEPWFGVSPLALASFAAGISRRSTEAQPVYWREELASSMLQADQPALFDDDVAALLRAGELIEGLIANAAVLPLRELMHHVMTRLGVLSQAFSGPEQIWNLQLLNTVFDFVRDEGAKGPLGLEGVLDMVDDMLDQGISLPAEKLDYDGDGVNFVTAHGAKGLEFDHVFLIGCTSGVWDAKSRNHTYTFPANVGRSIVGSEEEESRRLFYVAMTRARKQLVVTWPAKDNNDKALEQSRFVAELTEANCPVQRVELAWQPLVDFGTAVLAELPARDAGELLDHAFLDKLLENYSLSVTHLSAYLKCPTMFYFQYLLRVPAKGGAALFFGLAIHYAMENLFRMMLNDPDKKFPPAEVLVDLFSQFMERHRNEFTAIEYKRRMEYGVAILPRYYARYVDSWGKNVLVEKVYRGVSVKGVPVNGKLDKGELSGAMLHLSDYKTGQYEKAKKKLLAPDLEKIAAMQAGVVKTISFEHQYGGDYWRQAVFYRVLAETDPHNNWLVDRVTFDFVEPDRQTDEFRQAVVNVDERDVEIVTKQIVEVYDKIRNKEFFPGCDDPDCEWCKFVREYTGERLAA